MIPAAVSRRTPAAKLRILVVGTAILVVRKNKEEMETTMEILAVGSNAV
jgi:hypothetical protein